MYMDNRKKILKDMKKQKKNYELNEEENYLSRFILTIGLIIVLLIGLYLIVGIFVTKSIDFSKKEETKEEVTIDNSTILMGEIFDQKEDSYYVLIYDKKDDKSSIDKFLSLYKSKTNKLTVYEVDSSLSFNSKYIVEKDSNKNPTGYDDLKVISPTLIKIENKTVTEYNEGFDSIKEIFK